MVAEHVLPPAHNTNTHFQRMIDIDERRLALTEMGSGSPTVILEAALGATHEVWHHIQSELAEFTHVISYDRAGLGASDPVTGARTVQDMLDDLRSLLAKAEISGPYILVGHAFGGLIMQLFAAQYPDEVAGVILVDSLHADWHKSMCSILPPETPGEDAQITYFRKYCHEDIMNPASMPEYVHCALSDEQVRSIQSLHDALLVVITAGDSDLPLPYAQLWKNLQKEFLQLSIRSTQLIATESDHNIPKNQPQVIITTILQMVRGIRTYA